MMFSREAMTASATEAATPPSMPSTTNRRLRRGVMIHPPLPFPPLAVPLHKPPHETAAQTINSTPTPGRKNRSRATHSARSRPWPKNCCSSWLNCLSYPRRLPLPVEHLTLQAHTEHCGKEQHETQPHGQQRP